MCISDRRRNDSHPSPSTRGVDEDFFFVAVCSRAMSKEALEVDVRCDAMHVCGWPPLYLSAFALFVVSLSTFVQSSQVLSTTRTVSQNVKDLKGVIMHPNADTCTATSLYSGGFYDLTNETDIDEIPHAPFRLKHRQCVFARYGKGFGRDVLKGNDKYYPPSYYSDITEMSKRCLRIVQGQNAFWKENIGAFDAFVTNGTRLPSTTELPPEYADEVYGRASHNDPKRATKLFCMEHMLQRSNVDFVPYDGCPSYYGLIATLGDGRNCTREQIDRICEQTQSFMTIEKRMRYCDMVVNAEFSRDANDA